MNYIIPEEFDFYKELQKELNNKTDETDKTTENNEHDTCLIDGTQLDKNTAIKLDCGHTFNYISLLNDAYEDKHNRSKNFSYYSYSQTKLRDNQLRCPYCRQIQEHILPYFPDIYPKKINGINYPPSLSMGNNTCNYVFKSGKNKGAHCGRKCYRSQCSQHFKADISYDNIERNMETLQKFTMSTLRKIAKHYNLKRYSTLKKNDLIKKIIDI